MTSGLLAIECSQRVGGIALTDPSGRAHVHRFEAGTRHGDVLLPAIDRLCTETGIGRDGLSGCGVSIGPGGFTGLRVSIATARTIAWTLGIPVYGIPSALVVSASLDPSISTAVVALAGKGVDAWLTGTVRDGDGWRIDRAGTLVDATDAGDWFEGHGLLVADEHLPESIRDAAAVAGWGIEDPQWDAGACLELVRQRHAASGSDDPHTLLPIYPRVPEAVSLWEARKRV
ncbi:MAG: tRNA (adenosine(37)-N6)-threonylcarbamoyltransferase complex dimerization subunit type 1 TsaB [Planctomycetota bacterium]|nr:tRNA (adenosine(37)-N6)-threonylcarbamoyltransferase complex dimerization subunit type 1 TsaB [Planctomycetota bacterium]